MAEYSHIIFFCLQSCKQLNYSPSCESTLYQILKELKPFQRHSLAGLDDITTWYDWIFDFKKGCFFTLEPKRCFRFFRTRGKISKNAMLNTLWGLEVWVCNTKSGICITWCNKWKPYIGQYEIRQWCCLIYLKLSNCSKKEFKQLLIMVSCMMHQ